MTTPVVAPELFRPAWRAAVGAVVVVAVIAPSLAPAQQAADLVDWYHAAAYGTGVYEIGDKTAAMFRIRGTHTLVEPGGEQVGLRLTFDQHLRGLELVTDVPF